MKEIKVRDAAFCPLLDGEFGNCQVQNGPERCIEKSSPFGVPDECPLKIEGGIIVLFEELPQERSNDQTD